MTLITGPNQREKTFSLKFYDNSLGNNFSLQDLTIDALIQRVPFLPALTALLGISEEKMPVTLNFQDERLASVLIANDDLLSIRQLMVSMIRSFLPVNSPLELQYIMISDLPDKWMAMIHEHDPNYDFCAGVVGGDEISAEDWVIYLAQKVETRLKEKVSGTTILLFVDDLAIIERMDKATRSNFNWLLQYGALVNIWVIGGLDFQKSDQADIFLGIFKTKIFGQVDSKFHSNLSDFLNQKDIVRLNHKRLFVSKIGKTTFRFWAPKLQ